ncbi:MAG: polymer-forming cytoskeletal protein [Eubacterium sp.]|nr:polymer-forming cytoskeletal protein [Eubacterium sp.]
MSFFKDLKDDIAQSVNELTETFDEDGSQTADVAVEDLGLDDSPMPDDIEEPAMMFTKPAEEIELPDSFTEPALEIPDEPVEMPELSIDNITADTIPDPIAVDAPGIVPDYVPEEPSVIPDIPAEPVTREEPVSYSASMEPAASAPVASEPAAASEKLIMEDTAMDAENMEDLEVSTDEVTVITKGTTINGGIKSDTSLVVKGTIEGDVECAGKLTITGKVAGNTNASEIYVNTPRLEGDLNSKGIVKIDVGTVVIGGINSASVVVAGAVKGNIEVNGPVIIDSTAVVKGDIKAKSIQINSGAVIDGHCSLQFADVDLDTFFE